MKKIWTLLLSFFSLVLIFSSNEETRVKANSNQVTSYFIFDHDIKTLDDNDKELIAISSLTYNYQIGDLSTDAASSSMINPNNIEDKFTSTYVLKSEKPGTISMYIPVDLANLYSLDNLSSFLNNVSMSKDDVHINFTPRLMIDDYQLDDNDVQMDTKIYHYQVEVDNLENGDVISIDRTLPRYFTNCYGYNTKTYWNEVEYKDTTTLDFYFIDEDPSASFIEKITSYTEKTYNLVLVNEEVEEMTIETLLDCYYFDSFGIEFNEWASFIIRYLYFYDNGIIPCLYLERPNYYNGNNNIYLTFDLNITSYYTTLTIEAPMYPSEKSGYSDYKYKYSHYFDSNLTYPDTYDVYVKSNYKINGYEKVKSTSNTYHLESSSYTNESLFEIAPNSASSNLINDINVGLANALFAVLIIYFAIFISPLMVASLIIFIIGLALLRKRDKIHKKLAYFLIPQYLLALANYVINLFSLFSEYVSLINLVIYLVYMVLVIVEMHFIKNSKALVRLIMACVITFIFGLMEYPVLISGTSMEFIFYQCTLGFLYNFLLAMTTSLTLLCSKRYHLVNK